MQKKAKLIFVNQYTGYLFIDIVNAFIDTHRCELYTGKIDQTNTKIDSKVKIVKLAKYKRNSAVGRIYTWFLFSIQAFLKLLLVTKDAEVFLVSNPPFLFYLGWILHKLRGTSYNLLVYDIYPDVLINFKIINKGSIIDRFWSAANRKIYSNAKNVFTISEGMSAVLKAYYPEGDIKIIPNWSDTDFIKSIPKEKNHFALANNQIDKLTVMYSGNMGATHPIENVTELSAVFKNDDTVGFILIGDGAKRKIAEGKKAENNLDNLLLLNYQPADLFPYSLACADIGIVMLDADAESLSVPSKTYNLLAAGVILMVIASSESELAKLTRTYKCGRQFHSGEILQMAEFIKELKRNKDLLNEMKSNSLRASLNFTNKNAITYRNILNAG